MKTKNHWAEIRTDYEDDFFRRVDAWKTDDDNEEGEVIAQVDMLTGRIVYINPLARIDEAAQEAIRSLVDEAKKNIHISHHLQKQINIHCLRKRRN